jgi:hypothetical protein
MASFSAAHPATAAALGGGGAARGGAKRASSSSRRVGPRAARVCGGHARPLVRSFAVSDGSDASDASSATASEETTAAVPKSKSQNTIDALSALLGDDGEDEEAKLEEEADRMRAEKAALFESEKADKVALHKLESS